MVLPVGPSRGPLAVRGVRLWPVRCTRARARCTYVRARVGPCCHLPLLVLPCCSMNVALVGVRRPARSLRTPPVPLGVQWLGAHVAR